MARGWTATAFALASGVALAALPACSSSSSKDGSGAGSAAVPGVSLGGASAAGGASGSSGDRGIPGIPGVGVGPSPAGGFTSECAGEVFGGELVPLDMFVMLDVSGSMVDATASGASKWDAVKAALTAFLSDRRSAGIGVGLQFFPLRKAGVPATCTSDAQCGANGGSCVLDICWGAAGILPCQTDADCRDVFQDVGPCRPFAVCQNDESYLCANVGQACQADPPATNLGLCVQPPSFCDSATECAPAAYATPAVPIAELPAARAALLDSIEAQVPSGLTPTGPALGGAIEQARGWAAAHPGRTAVTVLATDGLPTECTPVSIPNIGRVAALGLGGAPRVRTFVIGVFGPSDASQGESPQQNLDSIARAGGTERAYMVDTTADVSAQFLNALNEIRGTELGCEFQIPQPTNGESLDYGRVNVQLTSGSETGSVFFVRGSSAAACPPDGGWYYDTDPAVAAPSTISFCPATCRGVQAAEAATVQIQLGCQTIVR